MDKKIALQIISEALDLAINKGCYGLIEVTNIVKALEEVSQNEVVQSVQDVAE
jgi:hypothetical protein